MVDRVQLLIFFFFFFFCETFADTTVACQDFDTKVGECCQVIRVVKAERVWLNEGVSVGVGMDTAFR